MNEVMRPSRSLPVIYLYRKPVDFRKSFNGLSAIVERELGHNVFEGRLYGFTNVSANPTTGLYSKAVRPQPVRHFERLEAL
ncbi:IS66 family insertion sequence element accessory protein TnpB [Teredinibacter franksiae]|uniref:IS66 family insertion sequence element accessory protein TnpB n=1 Tax=Teredinibacter franksiae TaxID=2761453 RepID=UPI001629217C|nr:IS66 family insertion sequence element accessory protein TnpB [Teredinibacter franksiae]